jgi:hypothetical protein
MSDDTIMRAAVASCLGAETDALRERIKIKRS